MLPLLYIGFKRIPKRGSKVYNNVQFHGSICNTNRVKKYINTENREYPTNGTSSYLDCEIRGSNCFNGDDTLFDFASFVIRVTVLMLSIFKESAKKTVVHFSGESFG